MYCVHALFSILCKTWGRHWPPQPLTSKCNRQLLKSPSRKTLIINHFWLQTVCELHHIKKNSWDLPAFVLHSCIWPNKISTDVHFAGLSLTKRVWVRVNNTPEPSDLPPNQTWQRASPCCRRDPADHILPKSHEIITAGKLFISLGRIDLSPSKQLVGDYTVEAVTVVSGVRFSC